MIQGSWNLPGVLFTNSEQGFVTGSENLQRKKCSGQSLRTNMWIESEKTKLCKSIRFLGTHSTGRSLRNMGFLKKGQLLFCDFIGHISWPIAFVYFIESNLGSDRFLFR